MSCVPVPLPTTRAAYIASSNKPTLDKAMFDTSPAAGSRRKGGGKGGSGGGGRASMAMDRQAEAAKEARLKGPQPFPLQRLIR